MMNHSGALVISELRDCVVQMVVALSHTSIASCVEVQLCIYRGPQAA